MAESYIVHLTDPLSSAFAVKAYSSNGAIFPTSGQLNATAVGAATSLLVYGKGHPNYGERIQENILHLLENFSGSSEPQNPVSGQVWFTRYVYVQTSTGWFRWDDSSISPNGGSWTSIVPVLTQPVTPVNGGHWFNGTFLFLGINDSTHPLSPTWLKREYELYSGLTTPDPAVTKPRKVLRVFDGVSWKKTDNVLVSQLAPTNPVTGDLWYDSLTPQLMIRVGAAWVSVADRYLLKSGGTMTGSINMNSNAITNVPTPTLAGHAANKQYVDDEIAAISGGVTDFDDLTDVTVADNPAAPFLKLIASVWTNHTLVLTDVSDVTVTVTEVNHLTGVTSNVQTQLNAKLNLSGGTLTNFLTLHADPSANLHAATKQYVDNEIVTAVSAVANDGVLIDATFDDTTFDLELTTSAPSTFNVDLSHPHPTTEINHTTDSPLFRDLFSTEIGYPTVTLESALEEVINNINIRLSYLESFSFREVFVISGTPTQVSMDAGEYKIGVGRLRVYVNGVKQYADPRAMQSILFDTGINLSVMSPTGLAADATTYSIDIDADGSGVQTVTATGANLQTIQDIIDEINAQTTGCLAVWDNRNIAINVWSNTTGNGSSIDIVDDTLLAALAAVTPGPGLPITLGDIEPTFPSPTTDITVDADFKEVDDSFAEAPYGTASSSIEFNAALTNLDLVEITADPEYF